MPSLCSLRSPVRPCHAGALPPAPHLLSVVTPLGRHALEPQGPGNGCTSLSDTAHFTWGEASGRVQLRVR